MKEIKRILEINKNILQINENSIMLVVMNEGYKKCKNVIRKF
jgi:hypothetical protein